MPRYFSPRTLRGCTGKRRHATQGKAQAAARALQRFDEREGRPVTPVNTYWCVRCRSWHIGHAAEHD